MRSWDVVRGFECELALYTGARYCVAVNSGTSAAKLAFEWYKNQGGAKISFPHKTYRSMVNMAEQVGLEVFFSQNEWKGEYRMWPTTIWDCALRLQPGMYQKGAVQLLSFHPQKPLALSSGGGAILHDDSEADRFYRLGRFDARVQDKDIRMDDWPFYADHMYMFPGQAGEALHRLEVFKAAHPEGLIMPQPDYEDLIEKLKRRENAPNT